MLPAMKPEREILLFQDFRFIKEKYKFIKYGDSILRIKELRTAAGLSQKKLSEKTNVARSYISELERGVLNNPTIDIVCKLAKGLGCTLDELIIYKE
jgi:putative transcriptional regulator